MIGPVVVKMARACEGFKVGDFVVGRLYTPRWEMRMIPPYLRVRRLSTFALLPSDVWTMVDSHPALRASRCRGCLRLRYTIETRCKFCGSTVLVSDNPRGSKTGGVL